MPRIGPETPYSGVVRGLVVVSLALGACTPYSRETQVPCGVEKVEYSEEVVRFHFIGECGEMRVDVSGRGWNATQNLEPFDVEKFTLDIGLTGPIIKTQTDIIKIWEENTLIHEWTRQERPTG